MSAIKNWFVRIVELGLLPADSAETRLKKVTLTLVPLITCPVALVWGAAYISFGYALPGLIPLAYSVISVLSLVYFFKTKRTLFIQYSQLTLVLLLPFVLMWSLGGFSAGSMVMIWAIFSPIAAVMFLDKRSAVLWFVIFIVLIVISVMIDEYVAAAAHPIPLLARNIFYLLNIGCASAGLYLLVSYSINEEKRANKSDLLIATSAFEAQDSLIITNADGVILRTNRAFTNTTGYTAEDLIGQTPRILKSDRHDAGFYRTMWESITQNGSWQGEIWDKRKDGEIYPKLLSISAVRDENGKVTHYVGAHLDITERKANEDRILQLAFYDPLTRLPNRQLLLDRMQRALISSARSGQKGALLFIDLDNFKTINDTIGHAMGDLLLQQVAERLLACVREYDTVARLGGDEFVVMLEDLSKKSLEAAELAETVGEKILAALSQPYQLTSHVVRSSSSVGITLINAEEYEVDEVLRQSDIAMYQAKKSGKNAFRFFDPEMQQIINTRTALESALYKSLELQQFQLYYQVQVNNSRQPIGGEVLIRWLHPELGMSLPDKFIPLAEETGLILPIGKWVLDLVCAQLKKWESNAQACNLELAVNISASQFHQTDFVDQIRELVQKHAINPALLKLEITESILLEDTEETIATMHGLKEIGIKLSLDDFGTGYSSLQYLKLLPLDQIKIDQSFVRDITIDPNDAAIVRTIIAMTNALGLDVIAEGVETSDQHDFLKQRGCNDHQGFLFGKPMPLEEFEASLVQV
jgi:diguanylate cyclase (GGDEF)-like protein/PAS domain S-box-containing protein